VLVRPLTAAGCVAFITVPGGAVTVERGLSRVGHFAQDRLQDFRALQGTRPRGPDRSLTLAAE